MTIVYCFLFFLTALFYSAVGFGGGSTYLALLALMDIPYTQIPKIALLCNLIVVSGGLYFFAKEKVLSLRKASPFVILSIPCAYYAGKFPITENLFLMILAISLLFAGIRLLLASPDKFRAVQVTSSKRNNIVGMITGALLGTLSGLVGIGGGIFLAPLLYWQQWGSPKQIAAMASFFIWVNSIAGLIGQVSKSEWDVDWTLLAYFAVSVFIGGQIGSRAAAKHLPKQKIQKLTGLLILVVATRILFKIL